MEHTHESDDAVYMLQCSKFDTVALRERFGDDWDSALIALSAIFENTTDVTLADLHCGIIFLHKSLSSDNPIFHDRATDYMLSHILFVLEYEDIATRRLALKSLKLLVKYKGIDVFDLIGVPILNRVKQLFVRKDSVRPIILGTDMPVTMTAVEIEATDSTLPLETIAMDDTTGWKGLEPLMRCLKVLVEECGVGLYCSHRLCQDGSLCHWLVTLAGAHLNRHIRQFSQEMIGVLIDVIMKAHVSPDGQSLITFPSSFIAYPYFTPRQTDCAGSSDNVDTNSLITTLFLQTITIGLTDNWCQIRLAASLAMRSLLKALDSSSTCVSILSNPTVTCSAVGDIPSSTVNVNTSGLCDVGDYESNVITADVLSLLATYHHTIIWPSLLPHLCLNRYYGGAEGVRRASQDCWKESMTRHGRGMLALYLPICINYYNAQTLSTNHMIVEAACSALGEAASKLYESDKCKVFPFLTSMFESLDTCLSDASWPVRDAACIPAGLLVRHYLSIVRSVDPVGGSITDIHYEAATQIVQLLLQLTADSMRCIRSNAAFALAEVLHCCSEPLAPPALRHLVYVYIDENMCRNATIAPPLTPTPLFAIGKPSKSKPSKKAPVDVGGSTVVKKAKKVRKATSGWGCCVDCARVNPIGDGNFEATEGCLYLFREVVGISPLDAVPIVEKVNGLLSNVNMPNYEKVHAQVYEQLGSIFHMWAASQVTDHGAYPPNFISQPPPAAPVPHKRLPRSLPVPICSPTLLKALQRDLCPEGSDAISALSVRTRNVSGVSIKSKSRVQHKAEVVRAAALGCVTHMLMCFGGKDLLLQHCGDMIASSEGVNDQLLNSLAVAMDLACDQD